MIHDNENVRKDRRASAGRDGNVKAGPILGGINFGPNVPSSSVPLSEFKKLMRGEPRRDVDSLDKRLQVLEAFCEKVRHYFLEKLGYDFEDGPPPPAEAST